jgi:hypothetical protein
VIYKVLLAVLERTMASFTLSLAYFPKSQQVFLFLHKTTDLEPSDLYSSLERLQYQYDPTLSLQVRCLVKNSYFIFLRVHQKQSIIDS